MYITVNVTPSARKEVFEKKSEIVFGVFVKEPPRQNKANMRVRELVAQHFAVSLGRVKIITGHRSPKKIISVETDL
jgi:uncharacterized protein YggU (UPF0235/DUF167 family)